MSSINKTAGEYINVYSDPAVLPLETAHARAHTWTLLKPFRRSSANRRSVPSRRENSEIAISLPFFTGSSDDFSLDFFFTSVVLIRGWWNLWQSSGTKEMQAWWIDAGLQYSFAITTGVRLRPVMRGGTLPFRERRSSPLCCAALLLHQFYTRTRADTHVNCNMIKRASKISLIKFDSSSRS